MNTAVPQFHEIRLTLTELDAVFTEFIGGPEIVDIGETLRVMLGDYFYSEPCTPNGLFHTDKDRTIVFAFGRGQTLTGMALIDAIEAIGEVFWVLADTITNRALQLTATYQQRPNECFYKFFAQTRELVIYTPMLIEAPRIGLVTFDGRAVIEACRETLPSWIRNALPPD